MTWKMSSASPGGVPVHASDRSRDCRLEASRGRTRVDPTYSFFTGDGRTENVQSAADENEEWAKVFICVQLSTRSYVLKMVSRR
jgi:hypothetical protein